MNTAIAPVVLAGLTMMLEPDNGDVRVVRGNVEVFAPNIASADAYTGCIQVPGHLVQLFDAEIGKWVTECCATDAHFCLPHFSMTPAVRMAADIDRKNIDKAAGRSS